MKNLLNENLNPVALLLFSLLILQPTPVQAKNDIFGAVTEVNTSGFAGSGKAVDLDNDGDLDLVSSDQFISYSDFPIPRPRDEFGRVENASLIWFENIGHGGLRMRLIDTPNTDSIFADATDLDGDGDMDIVAIVNHRGSERTSIFWYENDGRQSFSRHWIFTAQQLRSAFGIADIDADGDVDLVIQFAVDRAIIWLENNGNQRFELITTNASGTNLELKDLVDIDADGAVDILSSSRVDDTISWHKNNGNGVFSEQIISTAFSNPLSPIAADLDGDGDIDILSAGRSEGPDIIHTLAWFENDGNEHYSTHIIGQDDLLAPFELWTSDIDGDGDIDVLAQRWGFSDFFGYLGGPMDIAWYENDGQQGFQRQVLLEGFFRQLTIADMDSDGDLDLVRDRTLFENAGQQNFVSRTDVAVPALGVGTISTTDLDADGDFDLVSSPEPSRNGSVIWHEHIDKNLFISHVIGDGKVPVVADLNQDGVLDIVYALNGLGWYEYDGHETFTQHIIANNLHSVDSVFAADMDADGDTDILTESSIIFPSETAPDGAILWYENDGQQRFSKREVHTKTDIPQSVDPEDLYQSVVAADIDGDGDMDVLSASAFDNTISWHQNNGRQTFSERTISNAAPYPMALLARDMDGDGDIDVLAATRDDGGISWYENVGASNFVMRSITTGLENEIRIAAQDIDDDGDIDVLATFKADDTVAWFENNGQQGFSRHLISDSTPDATGVAAADMDGDGDTDVVSAAQKSATIDWHENTQVYRGLAFDPARSGHGYEFQKRVDNSILLFFSYDEDGNPEWFFGVGDFDNGVFRIPEGDLNRVTYDSANRSPVTVPGNGSASIDFTINADDPACTESGIDRTNSKQISRFEWSIDGESDAWCSELLLFAESPSDPNFGGAWFAGEADDGWGLSISTQGDLILAILYFYDANGTGRWLWGNAPFSPGQDVSLEMLQFTGYCRGCERVDLENEVAGRLDLRLSEPDLATNDGNRATVNVRYLGEDGGSWERIDSPIRLLSDPSTSTLFRLNRQDELANDDPCWSY